MASDVRVDHVRFVYQAKNGETTAIDDLNAHIRAESFVSVVGPSGCGKSTLLSMIAGLIRPTDGEVRIGAEIVDGPSPRVGYMLQHDYLFPWRTILQNACLGLEVTGTATEERRGRVHELLTAFGLGRFEQSYPNQLSGGMRQRAALARTLVLDPDVLLLDEPFSALDYQTRLTLEDEVAQTLRERRKTVVLVTHDISEAIAMSDRVIVLSQRPARIKLDLAIDFGPERSALATRKEPEFQRYFAQIWGELDVQRNATA